MLLHTCLPSVLCLLAGYGLKWGKQFAQMRTLLFSHVHTGVWKGDKWLSTETFQAPIGVVLEWNVGKQEKARTRTLSSFLVQQRSDLKVCRFCHCVQFLLRRTMHSGLSSGNRLLLPYSLPALVLCCLLLEHDVYFTCEKCRFSVK